MAATAASEATPETSFQRNTGSLAASTGATVAGLRCGNGTTDDVLSASLPEYGSVSAARRCWKRDRKAELSVQGWRVPARNMSPMA